MSLEIPSACAPLSAVLCVMASLHVRERLPRQWGAACLLLLRNDVVCAHLVWSGPSRGWRREPVAPRRLWPWTTVPGCCMICRDPPCALLLWGQNGTEPSRRTLGQGKEGSGQPGKCQLWDPACRRGKGGGWWPRRAPELSPRATKGNRKTAQRMDNLRVGGILATAFRVLPGAPGVVWVWLTGGPGGVPGNDCPRLWFSVEAPSHGSACGGRQHRPLQLYPHGSDPHSPGHQDRQG